MVINNDGEILLVAHRKNDKIYWLLPGGGVNYGESLEEALKREFLEELSMDVDVLEPVLICDSIAPGGRRHILNICFRCAGKSDSLILGRDTRLYDYKFFGPPAVSGLEMYPPVNSQVVALMMNEKNDIYVGKIWVE